MNAGPRPRYFRISNNINVLPITQFRQPTLAQMGQIGHGAASGPFLDKNNMLDEKLNLT